MIFNQMITFEIYYCIWFYLVEKDSGIDAFRDDYKRELNFILDAHIHVHMFHLISNSLQFLTVDVSNLFSVKNVVICFCWVFIKKHDKIS